MGNSKWLSLGKRGQDGDRTVVKKKKKVIHPQIAKEHHLIGVLFKRSGRLPWWSEVKYLSMRKTQVKFRIEQDPTCHRALITELN